MVGPMSFLAVLSKPWSVCPQLILIVGCVCAPAARAGSGAAAVVHQLPDVEVRSLATSKDVRLARALAGRPAVLLLTDGSAPPACSVSRAAADLQRDFAPWFSWVAVLSGPFTIDDLETVRSSSPARFERLYLDSAGAVRASLGIARLPVLLLVDGEGAVREVCSPDGSPTSFETVARKLKALAAASRRGIPGIEDFRLPLVGGAGLVSFLDVAGRNGTMVAFLQSQCLSCARELEVLDFARDRRAGEISFVAVFIDPAPDSRIRGFLAAAGATPDFVVRDPELKLATRYGVDAAPALLVIDPRGQIVLSKAGYRDTERDDLYAMLMSAFDTAARAAGDPSVVAEARRLNDEAGAFLREGKPEYALFFQQRIAEMLPDYPSVQLRIAEAALALGDRDLALRSLARYLAAQPQTYDSPTVRQTIAGLLAPGP